ncbi:MAG: rRNA maturation RNase YbeY [Clostridia bacterium]|nr:rRNA maturation RNase YbeY [Clostridia bacterium]
MRKQKVLIEWDVRCQIDQAIMERMQAAADLCLECENVNIPCAVTVCLCDDDTIAEINRQYRNIDRSTDVLSFPSVNYPEGKTAGNSESLLKQEYDDQYDAAFLGDLFISVPHLIAQAQEYGHTVKREAVYLLVHGICHLMGYDHIEDSDKERMRAMEEKILSAASVTRDEKDNAEDSVLLEMAREAMTRSYSPYSSYPVGAALHSTDGRIFTGCNVENASFGLTNCAERTAVFKAVSEGTRSFDVLAIAAKTKAWPCGACRQVLNEFAPDLRILVTWDGNVEEKTLRELLPEGFGPHSMEL